MPMESPPAPHNYHVLKQIFLLFITPLPENSILHYSVLSLFFPLLIIHENPKLYIDTEPYTVSRVKKIVATDEDIQIMSNAGAFVITLATEIFIQHLAQLAHSVAKSERKPRRNIQYRDLATAISNHDNLEFLIDIVPQTITFKQIKEKKTSIAKPRKTNGTEIIEVETGQTILNTSSYQEHATQNDIDNCEKDRDANSNS